MDNYKNIVETEVITQCIEHTLTSSSCCYKRSKTFIDSHQKDLNKFPENEAPQIIGHGSHTDTDDNDNQKYFNQIVNENNSKFKVLLKYEDAPQHLQFNPFIRNGYRTFLPTKLCLQSIFWWTNETINIWSHLLGYFLFVALTISDLQFLHVHGSFSDKLICGSLLVCFQLCMLLSAVYHIFSCRSAKDYDTFLTYDLFGIALVLLAIYMSGTYYAFWCHENLRNFYTFTVAAIFITAMVIQIPQLNISEKTKLGVFLAWSVYGFIPLVHWTFMMGGLENPLVKLLVPRVIIMYLISGIAFLIYTTKVPERWFTGKVDFCGHSHNWWHLFILGALYHWHNTGIVYAEFRLNNNCSSLLSIYT